MVPGDKRQLRSPVISSQASVGRGPGDMSALGEKSHQDSPLPEDSGQRSATWLVVMVV